MYPPWHRTDDIVSATVTSSRGDARYHLIVERLPRQHRWDWTVWRPSDPPTAARHGDAPFIEAAMRAAAAAVLYWDDKAVGGSSANS
jgi:hypothetical protein